MADPTEQPQGGAPAAPAAPNNPTTTTDSAAGVPAADVQAQINAALSRQKAEFADQLKAATGHSDIKALTDEQLKAQGKLQELADAKGAEAQTYKTKYEQVAVSNALLTAAANAVSPAIVKDLLAAKAVVDDNGNVTIDGKPVADAVKQLLTDNPFLAKAAGDTGSGAPQNTGGGKQVTRAEFERMNPTGQAAHVKSGGSVV